MSVLNPTNIKPLEYKVLIQVEEVQEVIDGGTIIRPGTNLEREQLAMNRGTIVEASEMACIDWKGRKPKIGQRVYFNKYAGEVIEHKVVLEPKEEETEREREIRERGKQNFYRIMLDKHILAEIMEEEDG